MTNSLWRLIYLSENQIAGALPNIEREIRSILRASQANNSLRSVTGALIFGNGLFAQALEGMRDDIEKTFELIQRDTRHGNVQVLAFEAVTARGFPDWTMAYIGRSPEGQKLFGDLALNEKPEGELRRGDRVYDAMLKIAETEQNVSSSYNL